MERRNETRKQPQGNKKVLFAVMAAILVVLLVMLCLLFVRCDGTGTGGETTDPSGDTPPATTEPEEELLTFPCRIWDMELLPESLVDAGMAYANSNDNIYGNVILGGVDGKGVSGSKAFGYTFVGDYTDGDVFIMSPNALKEAGFPKNWKGAEMLWFWVGGSELLQNVRLEVIINGRYMPIDSVYYTIDEQGNCIEAGTIPIAYGTTTKRGRIRLDAGYEGWIGLPLSIYENPTVISSLQIFVGNSTVKAGNTLYLDEFWLTKMGEVPQLSLEELNYKTLDNLTLGQIWDAEGIEAGEVAGSIGANADRAEIDSQITAGKGVLQSQAIGYIIKQTNKTNTNNLDIQFNGLLKKGATLRAIEDPSNIVWFWVDSDLSSTQLLHLQLNGIFMDDGRSIYTIVDKNGTPELQEVIWRSAKGAVNGMSVVPYNGTTGGKYARIELSPGWSGWIGIPVGNFCVNSDGTAAEIPADMVSRLTVRLFGDQNSLSKNDALYLDEFWITAAGEMPDLSDEALVYGYTASYVRPVVYYGQIWSAESVSSGRNVGNPGSDVTRNTIVGTVVSGKGVSGSKALAYIQKSVGNTNGNNIELVTADLESVNFKTAVTTKQSDLLWFWVDSATDHDQLLHVQINGRLMDKTSIYTIVDVNGKATLQEIPYTDNGALISTGMGLVPSGGKKDADSTYARIKLCDGWSGWIGIPVNNFCLNSDGTKSEGDVERIIKYQIRNYVTNGKVLSTGDALYFDEFWLTKAGAMPDLSNDKLLYGYTAPEATSDSGNIWNAEHEDLTTNGQIISGMVGSNTDRTSASAGVYQQMGVGGSNALGYRLTTVNKTQSNNMDVSDSHLSQYGFTTPVIADGDMVWFWLYSDLSADQLLHVHLNDIKTFLATGKGIYTVEAGADGKPVKAEIGWYGTSTSVPTGELGVVYPNGSTEGGYARILIRAGWSGWIGIPVSNFSVDSSGNAVTAPVGAVSQLVFRLYGSNQLKTGDTLYFDEFWLTSGDELPDLSDEALLYTYQAPAASEDLALNSRYMSGMIFQHGKPWQVHGTGKAGETVTVALLDAADAVKQTATATVGEDGTWSVLMTAVDGSYDIYSVKVTCGEAAETLTDVVFGEVWVTSGQSNMFYTIAQTNDPMFNAKDDVAALKTRLAANSKASFIRMYTQGTPTADFTGEHTEANGSWSNASVWESVEATSAVAMHYIEQLQGKLDMPVGVVVAARGGTSIATWVDLDVINQEKYADFHALCTDLGYFSTTSAQYHVAGYFNSTVAPFQGYEVAGLLWYQGEQDRSTPDMQTLGFEVLVESYSKVFTTSENASETGLDVIAMQIAPFVGYINSSNVYPDADLLINAGLNAGMREGAAKVQAKGGNVVLIPIYDLDAIVDDHHPLNKKDVADRIIQVAFETYYDDVAGNEVYSGPSVTNVEFGEGKITITFDQNLRCIPLTKENNQRITKNGIYVLPAESELYSTSLNGFSIFTGTEYVSADAVITGENQVELTVPEGVEAAGVAYAYGLEVLSANLYDADALPALPFCIVREGFVVANQTLLLNFDALTDGSSVGSISTTSSHGDVTSTVSGGNGIGGSNALAYTITDASKNNSKNATLESQLAANTVADGTDIIWFWVDSDLTAERLLHVQINGNTMQQKAIYTIVNNNGVPEIVSVDYAGNNTTVDTMAPVNSNWNATSGTYARIKLPAGWYGWIGVPASSVGITSGSIEKIALRAYANVASAPISNGEVIYIDEIWLTSAGLMPNLTNEQLLHAGDVAAPEPETDLALSSRYESGMIFQQNKPWNVHGTGVDGETVTVTLLKGTETVQTANTTVAEGIWSVTMNGVSGSFDAYTLQVTSGDNTLTLEDVVFGEVWAVGGQSNMAYELRNITTSAQQTALQTRLAANDKASYIRFYVQTSENGKDTALADPKGAWGNGSDWNAVLTCSGTGFYFAEEMLAQLDMPVGIINTAVGGTGISAWVDAAVAETHTEFRALVASKNYDDLASEASRDYMDYLGGWYNSRLAPWSGYEVSGMLWYQGEHERNGNAAFQRLGIPVLVESWSKLFNNEAAVDQLPLVAIQIAPYYELKDPDSEDPTMVNIFNLNAAMKEGVGKVAATGKTAIVSQYDVYMTVNDIHPKNKPEVGLRAARTALGLVYGKTTVYSGPVVQDVTFADGLITITFSNVGDGLQYIRLNETDNFRVLESNHNVDTADFFVDKLNGFSYWNGTRVVSVDAQIVGTNQVQITLPTGTAVAAVYYGYGHEILSANLYGSTGFPAEAFSFANPGYTAADHQTPLWNLDESDNALTGGLVTNVAQRNQAEISRVSGEGVLSSNALGYKQTTLVSADNRLDLTNTMTFGNTNSLGNNGYDISVTVSGTDDIFWFWVDSDMSLDMRLQPAINGHSIPGGFTAGSTVNEEIYIYTIVNEDGTPTMQKVYHTACASDVDGIGLVNSSRTNTGNTGTQLKLVDGWSGWVGIPLNMLTGTIEPGQSITSFTMMMRIYDGVDGEMEAQVGNESIYFDEFWLTSAGKMPGLTNEALLYRSEPLPEPEPEPETPQDLLWNIEGSTVDIAGTYTNDTRNHSYLKNDAGTGVLGSAALKYGIASNPGHDMTNTINFNPTTYGLDGNVKITALDNIIWYWVDLDYAEDQFIQIAVNDASPANDANGVLYTIQADADGKPAIVEIPYGGNDTVAGIDLLQHSTSTNVAMIKLYDGFSGWIGTPVSLYSHDSSKALAVGDTISKIGIVVRQKTGGDLTNQSTGDCIYLDEFWLTSANTLPNLTNEELLHSGDPVEVAPETHQTAIWNLESGADDISVTRAHDTRNDSLTTTASGEGVSGSKALKYEATEADVITTAADAANNKPYARSITQTLSNMTWATYGGINATVKATDDIFWLWVDADWSTTQRFTFQLEGKDVLIQTEGETYIYTIVNVDGTATMQKVLYSADPADTVDSIDLVNENPNTNAGTKAMIRLSKDFCGWIGIPLNMLNGAPAVDSTLTKFSLLLNQYTCDDPIEDQQVGDTVYMDEFWLTSAGMMPDLTNEQLLYKGSASESDPDQDEAVTGVSILTFADGATVADLSTGAAYVSGTTTTTSLAITDGKGLNGKSAITVTMKDGVAENAVGDWWFVELNSLPSDVATVNTNAFTDILSGTTADDLMLWFYIDGTALTKDARLSFGMRKPTDDALSSGTYYYTFEKQYYIDAFGNVQSVYLGAQSNNAGVISSNARGRTTVEAGVGNWIGIPVNRFGNANALTSLGDIRFSFHRGIDRDNGNVVTAVYPGDALSIGDIWLTKKDADGNWTIPEPAKEGLLSAEYYTAEDYLADPTLFTPSWKDTYTVPAAMLNWEEKFTSFYTPNGRLMSVAHRGDRNVYYPENSLEGFMSVIAAGVDIIEVDVIKTADGIPIALHGGGTGGNDLTASTNLSQLRAAGKAYHLPASDLATDWTLDQLRQLRLVLNGKATDYVIPTIEDVIMVAKEHVFINLDKWTRYDWDTDILPLIQKTGAYETVLLSQSYSENKGYQYTKDRIDQLVSLGARKAGVMSEPWATSVDTVASNIETYGLPKILRLHEFKSYTTQYGGDEYELAKAYVGQYRIYLETLNSAQDNLTTWQEIVEYGGNIIMSNKHPYELAQHIAQLHFTPKQEPEEVKQTSLLNFNDLTVDAAVGTVGNNTSYCQVTASLASGKGISTSNAAAYTLESCAKTNSENLTLNFASTLVEDGDMIWFWVDSDMEVDRLLHVQLEGSHLAANRIYTIENVGGAPTVKEVAFSNGTTVGDGLALVASGGNGGETAAYARIRLDTGWYGWIGIPVANFNGNNSTAPTAITKILFRTFGAADATVTNQLAYFDELWLTEAGAMPNLTAEELLYNPD